MKKKSKKKRKHRTLVDKRHDRWRRENMKIDQAIRFQESTGLCPVCRNYDTAHGITCGRLECIRKWLRLRQSDEYREMVKNGQIA